MPTNRTSIASEDERRQRRREMVKYNVRALRRRRKEAAAEVKSFNGNLPLVSSCCSDDRPCDSIIKPGPNRISLSCEVSESNIHWVLRLPYRLSVAASSQDAFIAAFKHCCGSSQNTYSSDGDYVGISICCGSWVETVCVQAASYESSLISQALRTSALAMVGWMRQDTDMLILAQQAQSQVLSALRQRVNECAAEIDQEQFHRTSVALLTCAVTDLLISKSWVTFGIHLKGVGGLIEATGPANIRSSEEFLQFNGYRAVQVSFSFMERKSSFLSHPEWIGLSTSAEQNSHNWYKSQLLDIMYQLPTLMEFADQSCPDRMISRSEDVNAPISDVTSILTCLTKFGNDLSQWETRFSCESTYSPLEAMYSSSDKPWEQEVQPADTTTGIFYAFIAGARAAMYETASALTMRPFNVADGYSLLPPQDYVALTYKWAMIGCQCLNWSVKKQANISGKLYCLFCLDMIWKAFKSLHNEYNFACIEELCWCESIAEKLGQTGLPVLRQH